VHGPREKGLMGENRRCSPMKCRYPAAAAGTDIMTMPS